MRGLPGVQAFEGAFNRVFDVQPAGFSEGAACVLPER